MRKNRTKRTAQVLCLALALLMLPTAAFSEGNEKPEEQPVLSIAPEPESNEIEGVPALSETLDSDRERFASIELTLSDTAPKDADATPKVVVFDGSMELGLSWFSITAGDFIYKQFVPPVSGHYRFYSLTWGDAYGILLDASYHWIASADDGGFSKNFLIEAELTAGENYYIGAGYYSSTDAGSYVVAAELPRCVAAPAQNGRNYFNIATPGETVYRAFTPTVSGTYYIYGVTGVDTIGLRALSSWQVNQYDDDSGHGTDFEFSSYLDAGQTYYIGVKAKDNTAHGYATVMIEMRACDSDALQVGVNRLAVQTPGTTVYHPFTAPREGYYWFSSTGLYRVGSIETYDSFGTLADSGMHVYLIDDNSGYESFFHIRNGVYLTAGTTVYLGVRYLGNQTGVMTVMIEYPYRSADSPMSLIGANSFEIPVGGASRYRPFTPDETALYTVYSLGDRDTLGMLSDADQGMVFYDDNSGEGGNFRFSMQMNAGETYWIGAKFVNNALYGSIPVAIEKQINPFDGTIEWNKNDVQLKGKTPYRIYNGAAHTPRFTVRDANGSVVDPENYTYEYRENVNAGTGYVIVHFTNRYSGTARAWFKIYLPATTATGVENVDNGIRVSWNAVSGAAGYVIYRRAWSGKTGGWTTFERWNNTTALSWTDTAVYAGSRYQYGVKAYFTSRTDPVTGAFIGGNVGDNYNLGEVGPLKTTVRITARTLDSLKAGSKQITANWTGSSNFTGYEVQYATNAGFTQNVMTAKVSDKKTYSKTLKSLTNGTQYFVRVRSYHVFDGTTYYGQWSNVLRIKPGTGTTVYRAKNYALLVGEGDYSRIGEVSLPGGIYDINAMEWMLMGMHNAFNVKKLPNATKEQVISAIRSAYTGATESDVSLFLFAGHGLSTPNDPARLGALYTIDGQYITFSELAAELSKVKGRVIVILNSCHSGASINRSDTDVTEAWTQAAIDAFSGYTLESPDGAKMGELQNSKFIVIAAASAYEYGWHGGWDGSGYPQHALNSAIMKGVGCSYPNGKYSGSMPADKNKDKLVTLRELYEYVYVTVYNWTNFAEGHQHVQYYGPDDAILFKR